LSDIELPVVSRPNRSLPILDTELIRALNTIHVRSGGEKSPALREWYLARKEGLIPDFILDNMRDSRGTIRLDEAAPPYALAAQDLLTRYGSSIVPPRHMDGLHELRAIEVPFIRQDYILQPAVTEILGNIYELYSRTL
jgi:hypothetical protein